MTYTKLPTKDGIDLRSKNKKYAIIGDIHGCYHTLENLLLELGSSDGYHPPADLDLISVGDLNDKGPHSVRTLRWAMDLTKKSKLHTVDSNHGRRLARRLVGECKPGGSVEDSYKKIQLESKNNSFVNEVTNYLANLPAFLRVKSLNGEELVVAHAAAAERLINAKVLTPRERNFFLGADSFKWTGESNVVTGHVTVQSPIRTRNEYNQGHSIRIDTGVNLGNMLTAYLPDSDEFVSVKTDTRDLK